MSSGRKIPERSGQTSGLRGRIDAALKQLTGDAEVHSVIRAAGFLLFIRVSATAVAFVTMIALAR